jgi:excisionase family DNA binding protein
MPQLKKPAQQTAPKHTATGEQDLASDPIVLANTQPIVVVKPLLLSVALAASCLGIGKTMAWALIKSGALRTVRIGARRMVAMRDLEAFVEQLEEEV